MCGIVGFFEPETLAAAESETRLRAMLETIQHRGPDADGVWSQGGIGLGHARLSILDLSDRGRQPFVSSRGVLSYNGEIYNFKALRRELAAEGAVFRTETDTEVVLAALDRWGPERAVPRFDGMFGFAYYDRLTDTLWLARDRTGIKPLFVARQGERLVFASEQKALFAHPEIERTLDAHTFSVQMLYERLDGPMTPYVGVEAFEPGTLAAVKNGAWRSATYFDVTRDVSVDALLANRSLPMDECNDVFAAQLAHSVEAHLVSDAPLATMCSGGVDSSLVTALARAARNEVTSYVADIEGMGGEERRRAQIAASSIGAELRPVEVSKARYFEALPAAIAANDQPLFFSQEVAAMLVAQQIRADGFKVVLTGDGADEFFGGYPWHAQAYRRWRRIAWRQRWVPNNRATRWLGRYVPHLAPVKAQQLHRLGDPLDDLPFSKEGALLLEGASRHLRETDLFAKLDGLPLAERAYLAKSLADTYVHMRESLNTLDKMTMSQSIEARIPFLGRDVIQLGLTLPLHAKYHRGVQKAVLRRVAERYLPRDLLHAPKIGFQVPASMWSGRLGLLHDGMLADVLKWPRARVPDLLAQVAHNRYYQFRLLSAEIWLRMTFGGDSAAALTDRLLATQGTEDQAAA